MYSLLKKTVAGYFSDEDLEVNDKDNYGVRNQ